MKMQSGIDDGEDMQNPYSLAPGKDQYPIN